MKKTKNKKEYTEGIMPDLFDVLAEYTGKPAGLLREVAARQIPALRDKERCPNCNASMQVEIYKASMHTVLLLIAMAKEVRHQVRKGVPFTEANKIHIPSLATTDAIRHHVTQARYINVVQQPKKWAQSGHWVITNWGWKALRGEEISAAVKVFRGEIIQRSSRMITLGDMIKVHSDKVADAIARSKAVRADYRADVRDYQPTEWREFAESLPGQLFND